MDNIICPHCGKQVEISKAIVHELSAKVRSEEKEKLKLEFEKEKAKESAEKEKKLRGMFALENKQKEKELQEAKQKEKEMAEKLAKEQKSLEEAKKLALDRGFKEANDKFRLEKLELEKKNADMQRSLEEAQRKGKQGSQQLQGEVLELDLEDRLKKAFPADEFVPIPKGVKGADIWQKIRFQNQVVGSIIWETKRTKDWRPIWLSKLKDDAAKINASEAIIVSQILPDGSSAFDRKDGIWITTYEHAIGIARYVSFLIKTVAKIKSGASQTDEDWSKIRDYMLSDSFKHRMQAHFDGVKSLREMLDTEKRTSTLRWTRQQKQIDKLDSNTVNFYAELKDIVHNLPELEEIETPKLNSGEVDNDQDTLL